MPVALDVSLSGPLSLDCFVEGLCFNCVFLLLQAKIITPISSTAPTDPPVMYGTGLQINGPP